MPGAGISASSKRVCSGLLTGGGGAFRVFDRRLRNRIGPRPVPDTATADCPLVDELATDTDDVDGTIIIGNGGGSWGDDGPGGVVDTTVVVITGITSSGVL